jgi:hypothetical protein
VLGEGRAIIVIAPTTFETESDIITVETTRPAVFLANGENNCKLVQKPKFGFIMH